MKGKIVVITGASSGIGKETAKGLVEKGATVIMACRNLEKSRKVRDELQEIYLNAKIDVMALNLASMASIYSFTRRFNEKYDHLHVLINNAGVFCEKREETEDGFEKTMGVNYFGLFLLTYLLLPTIKRTEMSRIINVTSKAAFHGKINMKDLNFVDGYHSFRAYSASKLAVILFARQLSDDLKGTGTTVNNVHPGSVATNMWRGTGIMMRIMGPIMRMISISPEKAAQTSIFLASSKEVEGVTGKLFYKNNIMAYGENCKDVDLGRKLWDYSCRVTGITTDSI